MRSANRSWLVLGGALEAANAAFVEVGPSLQRLDAMREMLIVDLDPRDIRHKTTEDLEVQRVPLRLTTSEFGFLRGQCVRLPRLRVQRVDNRLRIDQQLQQRIEALVSEA